MILNSPTDESLREERFMQTKGGKQQDMPGNEITARK
eukprot:gene24342-32254_t